MSKRVELSDKLNPNVFSVGQIVGLRIFEWLCRRVESFYLGWFSFLRK